MNIGRKSKDDLEIEAKTSPCPSGHGIRKKMHRLTMFVAFVSDT